MADCLDQVGPVEGGLALLGPWQWPDGLPAGSELSDEELTALALAADPDEVPADDALPLSAHLPQTSSALPSWYMPPVMAGRVTGWRVPVVVLLVGSFLVIDALGLCFTYGQLVAA